MTALVLRVLYGANGAGKSTVLAALGTPLVFTDD